MARSEKEQWEQPQEGARQTVADILATAREEYGQDLRSVSDALRIRFVYLQAIEEGRFDELPGLTYAVGFVRSYSDYLGLDTPTIVQQFKEEMGGAEKRQQLVFPVPKPEGKIPAGALVLISILLVALAYGGWYVLSQDDQSFMEMFSGEEAAPAPDDTQDAAPESDQAPTPEPAPESNAGDSGESEEASASGLDDELLNPGGGDETLPSAQSVSGDALEPGRLSDMLPPPEEETPSIEVAETPSPGATSGTAAGSGEESVTETAEEVMQQTEGAQAVDDQTAEAQDTTLPEAPAAAAPEDGATGEIFGADADESVRVIIEATHDSWVQVFGADKELMIARVLRAGDQFRVPDGDGLSMLTGNAGGLEVKVDGAIAPSLGPFGEVVRNIALDPVLLLNGTAVGAGTNPEQ